jgi:hypothetical protein
VEKRPPFINENVRHPMLDYQKEKENSHSYWAKTISATSGTFKPLTRRGFRQGCGPKGTDYWMPADSDSGTRGFHTSKRKERKQE